MNLEERLIELSKIGEPRIGVYGKGWHASLKFPAPTGCTAEVASDFDHKNPTEALDLMVRRMEALRATTNNEAARRISAS